MPHPCVVSCNACAKCSDAGVDSAKHRGNPRPAYKPGSVPIRRRATVIYLAARLPERSSGLPRRQTGRADPSPIFGLAPGGVCRASRSPGCWCALTLRLTPAPFHPYRRRSAETERRRRCAFCCTFPVLADGGRYPPPRPLEPGLSSPRNGLPRPEQRPSSRPADPRVL